MNPIAIVLLVICGIGMFTTSRKNAAIVLVISCCYMTVGQQFQIAGANFPFFRFIILLGVVRTIIKGESPDNWFNAIDKLVIVWAIWFFFASFFHEHSPGSGPKYAAGSILNLFGTYYLFRTFLKEATEIESFIATTVALLLPISISMFVEQIANYNIFSSLGYIPETPMIRNGRTRAQGSFSHPILAGSIGAACFPFAVALWYKHRKRAILGMIASTAIVITSASSGPIMSLFFAGSALFFWKLRSHFKKLKWLAISTYAALTVMMDRPAYYIISSIDLTGSSTGWHRSFLIEQSISYLNEWWLFGTDKTVHWMPRQGRISENHTDVTNYYLAFGVNGGLLCMLAVIAIVLISGKNAGSIANDSNLPLDYKFTVWCIGSTLFANAATSASVAFFGQAQMFFWIPVALLATLAYSAKKPSLLEN